MLRQIEGSQAVAEAVALCRPEVIAAYPISPQTHIVEALSDLVRTGELAPCEYLMVESEFAAMSACIGASATGARTYTATASQGLLYMAEALYNASGLGLPIVMTVANRAIGAPINIWNDHSDAMSQRDCGLDPALRRVQPGGRRPARPGLPARRGALAAGDGLHGRLRPHPRRRGVDVPDQEQVDAFLPPFEPRQVLDPDEPMTIGAMVGPEAFTEVKYLDAREAAAGARRDPRDRGRVSQRVRARLRRAHPPLPDATTPRRSSSRSARCWARSRTSSTSCASRA